MVDAVDGVLGLEFVDGPSVRMVLGGGADDDEAETESISAQVDDTSSSGSWEGYLERFDVTKGEHNTSLPAPQLPTPPHS